MKPNHMTFHVIALALVLGGGALHGSLTHRWQSVTRTDGPETRLSSIPLQFGEWDGKDGELSEVERSAAGVTHYLLRTYANQATGDVVTVTLMCGSTGPIAVHPPTACYRGAGYQQAGETRSAMLKVERATHTDSSTSDGNLVTHVFSVADFHRPARPEQSQPRIYWAWSNDGQWKTPESPRLEFAGSPRLFKLYATCESPANSQRNTPAPIEDLLKRLLPEVQRIFERPKS